MAFVSRYCHYYDIALARSAPPHLYCQAGRHQPVIKGWPPLNNAQEVVQWYNWPFCRYPDTIDQ